MVAHHSIRYLTENSRGGQLSAEHAQKLEQLLVDYLERLERGESPDTAAIVHENPELADELRENLAKLAALHRTAVGIADGGETLDELCLTDLAEPRTLGDFLLIRPIGRGGMGVVYEAEQVSLNRRVALKTLPLAAVLDPKQLTRFKNEAQAAALLEHPHIVSVFAVGAHRGVHYYAMQYIDGPSLADVVDHLRGERDGEGRRSASKSLAKSVAEGPQAVVDTRPVAALATLKSTNAANFFQSVARLGVQAAEALHYAHEMGVVHRDVKPSNLLLDSAGKLYMADFGLAMTQSGAGLTMTGDVLGTLRYMSPEQASGRRALVDRRTDIYSLGASLYELATLRPAFCEEDCARLLQQILTDCPRRPSQIDRNLPKDLETIILKALAKEPAERYGTAQELADDLQRFIRREPIRARRVTKFAHARSWCRRNKAMAGLLGTVIALLLVLSIGGPISAIRQTRLAQQAHAELNAKNINQLYQDWYAGNVERVGAELKLYTETEDPNEFLFEWEVLRRIYVDSRNTIFYEAPDAEANDWGFFDISPDGNQIACGMPENLVAIYDVKQRKFRSLKNEPEGGACAAVFTPDGKELITVSRTGVINRRDAASSRVVGPVIHCGVNPESTERYSWIQLSRDGKTAVVDAKNGECSFLVVVRLEDGHCTRFVAHDGDLKAFELSPDGSTLVSSGEDGMIKFWDLKGNQLHTMPCSYVCGIEFTEDGRKLVFCDYVKGVSILDATRFTELPGLRGDQRDVMKIATFRDEILATAGVDDRIVLWNMKSGDRLGTLIGHEGDISRLAFSPDGMFLVSAASDGTFRLWNLGESIRERHDPAATFQWWRTDMQFSSDGRKLVTCARPNAAPPAVDVDTRVIEWDTDTGNRRTLVPQGRHGRADLALIPGTEALVCGGPGEFAVRDRRSGELMASLDNDPLHEYHHIAVSPDGRWAAGGGRILQRPSQTKYLASRPAGKDCFVAICHLESRHWELVPLTAEPRWYIRFIEFTPDGNTLVVGGGEGGVFSRVEVFEFRGDSFQHIDHVEWRQGDLIYEAMSVNFSADSRLIGTVNEAGLAQIWSLRGPKWETTIPCKNRLFSLAFSPDGRILALGDSDGILLYDLKSRFPLATIPFGIAIRALEFSPDGRTLAWAAADGEIGFLRTTPAVPSH